MADGDSDAMSPRSARLLQAIRDSVRQSDVEQWEMSSRLSRLQTTRARAPTATAKGCHRSRQAPHERRGRLSISLSPPLRARVGAATPRVGCNAPPLKSIPRRWRQQPSQRRGLRRPRPAPTHASCDRARTRRAATASADGGRGTAATRSSCGQAKLHPRGASSPWSVELRAPARGLRIP